MRNEILRDVLAGCAGVLAVAATIGLPRASAPVQQAQLPGQHYVLLPHFSKVAPTAPRPPSAPRARITTGP
jgi:hypothetical protein